MSEKMRAVIVEDDKTCADELISFLKRFGEENGRDIEWVWFSDGDSFLASQDKFDVIFMDIEMPGTDGLSVVKNLRTKDQDVLVLFVTGLAQYAVNGYEVQAFDFMVKPVSYYSFAMKFARVVERLDSRRKYEVWVVSRHGRQLIKAENLKYIEIVRHTLIYHTTDGNYTGTGTLKSVIPVFEELPFSLCNQCYFVNLRFVTGINESYVYVGGDKLQISAPKRKNFLRALNNYLAAGEMK